MLPREGVEVAVKLDLGGKSGAQAQTGDAMFEIEIGFLWNGGSR